MRLIGDDDVKEVFDRSVLVGVLCAQDKASLLQKAEAAYKRKDYPIAFRLYKQGAQRGEAEAI